MWLSGCNLDLSSTTMPDCHTLTKYVIFRMSHKPTAIATHTEGERGVWCLPTTTTPSLPGMHQLISHIKILQPASPWLLSYMTPISGTCTGHRHRACKCCQRGLKEPSMPAWKAWKKTHLGSPTRVCNTQVLVLVITSVHCKVCYYTTYTLHDLPGSQPPSQISCAANILQHSANISVPIIGSKVHAPTQPGYRCTTAKGLMHQNQNFQM